MKNLFLSMIFVVFFSLCGFAAEKISPQQAEEMMASQNVVILDVRTKSEFDGGHVKNAILIPDTEIRAKVASVIPNKDETILVYCRSGGRSAAAAKILDEIGYKNVYDFGGILGWKGEIEK